MSKGNKILIISAVIVLLVCAVPIGLWVYIVNWGKLKEPSYTYNVSTLVKADGSEQNIYELIYYKNEDKSGLEMLDIGITSFVDETRKDVKTQGLQFVAEDPDTPIDWTMQWPKGYLNRNKLGKENWYWRVQKEFFKKRYYASFGTWGLSSGESYNYSSTNDFKTVTNDTTPLSSKTGFKISMQKEDGTSEIFLMSFKGKYFEVLGKKFPYREKYSLRRKNYYPSEADHKKEQGNFVERHKDGLNGFWTDYIDTFYEYDPYWFAHELYYAIQTMPAGTEEYYNFTWGDIFDFKKYDEENKDYTKVEGEEMLKVKNYVSDNVTFKVKIYERGAQKASDSMFNVIKGSPTYNLTGDKVYDDYFYGENILKLDILDFDLVQVTGNQYCLKMSESAYDFYSKYKKNTMLSICVDLDILKKKNYVFVGFTADSRLSEFEIYDIYTLETIDGQVVREEVDYVANA